MIASAFRGKAVLTRRASAAIGGDPVAEPRRVPHEMTTTFLGVIPGG